MEFMIRENGQFQKMVNIWKWLTSGFIVGLIQNAHVYPLFMYAYNIS